MVLRRMNLRLAGKNLPQRETGILQTIKFKHLSLMFGSQPVVRRFARELRMLLVLAHYNNVNRCCLSEILFE